MTLPPLQHRPVARAWPKLRPVGAFLRDERAATSIEYTLIAGLIFVMIVAGVQTAGEVTLELFTRVKKGFD